MADLKDPTQPAHYLVEVRDDGTALRNDGIALAAANSNIWYVMMTACGEMDEFDWKQNRENLKGNRRYWNGWACSGLTDDERQALAEDKNIHPTALEPLSDDAMKELLAIVSARTGRVVDALPSPKEIINLDATYFKTIVDFRQFYFPAWTRFNTATFSEFADFETATFSGTADFETATFSGDANFETATFNKTAYFKTAVFCGNPNFSNGKFLSRTSFSQARFTKIVPKFYQCTVHEDTSFTALKGHWPAITTDNADDSKRAYIRLRHIMNGLQKRDDEHFFFRQEMRCKAELEGGLYKILSGSFRVLSNYGHSVGRPVGWLFGLVMACAVIYFAYGVADAQARLHPLSPKGGFSALGQSIANSFSFFGFQRLYYGTEFVKDLPFGLRIMSGFQTVLSFILIFLLGLGLRNRFRLR